MPEETNTRSILVTGDVVRDHYLYEGRQPRSGSTIRLGTTQKTVLGGAALLYDLLKEVEGLEVRFGLNPVELDRVTANGYCLMEPCPRDLKAKDEEARKAKVWRIVRPLGFGGESPPLAQTHVNSGVLNQPHDIIVIDDAGLSFRRWPSHDAWPRPLLDKSTPDPDWIVWKLSSPVVAGDLWCTLCSGKTQDSSPKPVRCPRGLLDRTIGIVSINDLRVEAIRVAKGLSWERAALDLVHELCHNHRLADLRKLRYLIVSLDTDGVLIADFGRHPVEGSRKPEPRYQLVFDPGRLEGEFNAGICGNLIGNQTCLTAAVVSQIAKVPSASADAFNAIERGVCTGLCIMRRLLVEGHGPVVEPPGASQPGFPFKRLADDITLSDHEWAYGSTEVFETARSSTWSILASNAPGGKALPLWGLARRVALHGVSQLRQTPYFEVGKLFSVERTEIESLRTVQRLLLTYQADPKADKPLSIAVFGPPGSGKSFGVKQLAKTLFTDDVPLLEFNLSQFVDPGELHGLFHQIRDEVLRGKLPVVFWDEFDSSKLKWLQYLLAPMQDGTFQQGQITHPIGKCVFVFAGGTRSRFEDFGELPRELVKALEEAKTDHETSVLKERRDRLLADIVAMKVNDFKSRLAGYINVLGPNPSEDMDDITFPVRRALLLRVQLGVAPKQFLAIDPGLLNAFLKIKKYKHGARSLEKIAGQLQRAKRTHEFIRSDLPADSQLELHVCAEQFLALAENAT